MEEGHYCLISNFSDPIQSETWHSVYNLQGEKRNSINMEAGTSL